MKTRLIFALLFLSLFLVAIYWVSTWDDHVLEGRIERVDIPQLLVGPTEDREEKNLHVILINDQTEVTGIADSVQDLRMGQRIIIELVPNANLKIARSIEVTSE